MCMLQTQHQSSPGTSGNPILLDDDSPAMVNSPGVVNSPVMTDSQTMVNGKGPVSIYGG